MHTTVEHWAGLDSLARPIKMKGQQLRNTRRYGARTSAASQGANASLGLNDGSSVFPYLMGVHMMRVRLGEIGAVRAKAGCSMKWKQRKCSVRHMKGGQRSDFACACHHASATRIPKFKTTRKFSISEYARILATEIQ